MNPLDELKRMNSEIDRATEVGALKSVYFRLKEIGQGSADDFDVQIAVSETRKHLMSRGSELERQAAAPPATPVPIVTAPFPAISLAETAAPAPQEPAAPPPMPAAPTPVPFPFMESAPPAKPTTEPWAFGPAPPSTPVSEPQPAPAPVPAPPRPAAKPPKPLKPPKAPKPPKPPGIPSTWKSMVLPGLIGGVCIAIVLIAFTQYRARTRRAAVPKTVPAVRVDVATVPSGASVRVIPANAAPGGNNEKSCASNCTLSLAPGDYQVTASLDGFEPAAGSVHVAAGQPAQVSLPLQPQAQSVRLITDLDQGKVVLDDQPPVDLQEGQLVLDKVPAGSHTVKITGRSGDAAFTFQIADARLPAMVGPVTVHNLNAVLVASFGKAARVVTGTGPLKLAVNGQPQADAGPAGTDLANFQPGREEIVVGEGKDQRTMSEDFGTAPTITAFLKSDVNTGTLIISTGQDDVRVFLNDKEYRRRTQRGQLRIQTLGKVTVRVAKAGFLDEAPQTAEVKKGEEARLQFALKPQPQFGTLQIHGGTPDAEVLLDQKSVGTVGQDGTFSFSMVQPGDRAIELRHAQYTPKKLQRAFQAGQAVVLAGADAVLVSANGTIHLTRNPAGATVTYRRADETEPHEVHGNQIELPAGSYVFSATAPGFNDATTRVQLAGGESRPVEFALRERPAPVVAPVVVTHGMADFEDPQAWKKDGEVWVHKGSAFLPYKLPDKGIFTFTVQLLKGGSIFQAGKIRWCIQYVDSKNYLLSEMDRKNFWTGVIEKGTRLERKKAPHNIENPKAFTIQIEISPEQLVQRVQVANEWVVLDTFSETGRDFTQGKFGFLIQGNDEIAISDFKFVAK
jgi:hypothetical protein